MYNIQRCLETFVYNHLNVHVINHLVIIYIYTVWSFNILFFSCLSTLNIEQDSVYLYLSILNLSNKYWNKVKLWLMYLYVTLFKCFIYRNTLWCRLVIKIVIIVISYNEYAFYLPLVYYISYMIVMISSCIYIYLLQCYNTTTYHV